MAVMFWQRLTSIALFLSAPVFIIATNTFSSITYDITTMAANFTFNDTECLCDCEELEASLNTSSQAPSTHKEAAAAASRLAADLKLDKTNLSSATRKKISAPDNRPSAKGIGVVGIIVILAVIGSIVALDLTTFICDVKATTRRLLGRGMSRRGYGSSGRGGGGTGRSSANSSVRSRPMASAIYSPYGSHADARDGNQTDRTAAGSLPVVLSGVHDIKSRRELLLKHGGARQ